MNLKEAFRYQNFLDRLLNQTMATLSIQDNLLEVSKLHRRGKAIAGGEDETEVAEVPELVAPDAAISLALSIVKEKEALTKAIGVSKGNLAGGVGDMDAAIETNKCRQSAPRKSAACSGSRAARGWSGAPATLSTVRAIRFPISTMWRSPPSRGSTAPS